MNTKPALKERVLNDIIRLAERYKIKKVVLFGSRARGDNRERSDIDIACIGGDTVRFALDLEDEVYTLLKFDVVDLKVYFELFCKLDATIRDHWI